MAGFLDVLLRGLILAAQATAVGGVCFVLIALRASATPGLDPPALPRSLTLIAAGAAALAVGQALALGIGLFVLLHDASWPLGAALGTLYVQVSAVRVLAGLALAACALGLRRRGPADGLPARWLPPRRAGRGARSRPRRGPATRRRASSRAGSWCCWTARTGLAAAMWIGGLVHLTAAAVGRRDRPWPVALLRRFSNLAVGSVVGLVVAGVGLTLYYARAPPRSSAPPTGSWS